jgi:hypothetical protein
MWLSLEPVPIESKRMSWSFFFECREVVKDAAPGLLAKRPPSAQ